MNDNKTSQLSYTHSFKGVLYCKKKKQTNTKFDLKNK